MGELQRRRLQAGHLQDGDVRGGIVGHDGGIEVLPSIETVTVSAPATTCALVITRSVATTKPLPDMIV